MGHEAKVKADRIHRRKLFNGRTTAQELWRQTVIGERKCMHCQVMRAVGTINIFWPVADFEKDQPKVALKYATECGGRIPYVQFRVCGEPQNFVAMPVLYFCGQCRPDMEKFAARKPSYVLAEIRTGPDADKVMGQVKEAVAS